MANGENVEFQFRDWLVTNEREVKAARERVLFSRAIRQYIGAWENDIDAGEKESLTPELIENIAKYIR